MMRDLILQALKAAIDQYPDIIPLLSGDAAKIVEDGVTTHMKYEPTEGFIDLDSDWDDWEVTEEDIERAIKRWDEGVPEYAGLLDAQIEAGEDGG